MAKKKTTETAENAVVNQESKEPKKKQEDILLEMIQRYRISHTKNGIFIHIPKTNGKLEAYNLNKDDIGTIKRVPIITSKT